MSQLAIIIIALIIILVCDGSTQHNQTLLELHTLHIKSKSPSLLAHIISNQLKERGYLFLDDAMFGEDDNHLQLLSQTVTNISSYFFNSESSSENSNFSYLLGNVAGRREVAPGLFKVGGEAKNVLVTGHSEASYLEYSPLYLLFSCPDYPDLSKGGHTIVYPLEVLMSRLRESELGLSLLKEVAEFGVIYVRNDPSNNHKENTRVWKATGYPVWQERFPDKSRDEVTSIFVNSDGKYDFEWIDTGNDTFTLRTIWKMPGFRLHPYNHKLVWFNQLFAMNGRYWNSHKIDGMESIEHNDRPLHSLIGNGRGITNEEYELLEEIHFEIAVLTPWNHKGDVLAIDNFRYQHGRMKYEEKRGCVVHWGPGVLGGEYVFNPKDFEDHPQIDNDLKAVYKLTDELKWTDTTYQHISYRLKDGYLRHTHSGKFVIDDSVSDLYEQIYYYRNDVNVILHVNNPDINAITMMSEGFLPVDQSYYMLPIITHYKRNRNSNSQSSVLSVLGDESRLLLLENNGIIVLGNKIEEAFTRLFYAVRAAQSQVMAMSIHNDISDIIFPSKEIQKVTTNQSLNFNIAGYGHWEFIAWKRRYNLELDQDWLPIENNEIVFRESEYKIRKDLADAYHLLDSFGWTETIYQHITSKLPSNDYNEIESVLINAYGLEFGEVTDTNLMQVSLNGTILYSGDSRCAGEINPSGLALHSAIHEYRHDANVVIHCHHPAIASVSVHQNGMIMSLIDDMYYDVLSPITYHNFDSLSLAVNKTQLLHNLGRESNVLILRNHGIITIGKNVQQAFYRLFYTIRAAESQIKIMSTVKNYDNGGGNNNNNNNYGSDSGCVRNSTYEINDIDIAAHRLWSRFIS